MYIVFEGVVGTGKTTQSRMLVDFFQKKYPKKEVIWTREPGGSEVADAIRAVVQATQFTEQMNPICEAYLYAASRAHTLRTIVKPVLERGGIVVADRSVFSSMSWQGVGRGLGKEVILNINTCAVEDIWPTAVLYLYGDLKEMIARTFDAAGDKFEKFPQSFFEACEQGYQEIAEDERFASMWKTIPAKGTKEEVFAKILTALNEQGG